MAFVVIVVIVAVIGVLIRSLPVSMRGELKELPIGETFVILLFSAVVVGLVKFTLYITS